MKDISKSSTFTARLNNVAICTVCAFSSLISEGCQPHPDTISQAKQGGSQSIIIDSALLDSLKSHVQFLSDRHFCSFKTPLAAYSLQNNKIVDSIIEPGFEMISWYTPVKDTIDLVAHLADFESSALLLRFIGGKTFVYYYRAAHERQKYFRLNKTDSFSDQAEIPPIRCKLLLSTIPDTINNPIVYGHIDMESSDYYDKRDILQKSKRIRMKFYFRSQLRKFAHH